MPTAAHAETATAPDPIALVDAEYDRTARVARQIWDWAELGYLEDRSSGLIKAELAKEGFRVESGVAEIPTAFVAEWGTGGPVIAILAEYDALPALTFPEHLGDERIWVEGNWGN